MPLQQQEATMPNYSEPAVMTVQDFIRWARIGRTRVYGEINSGALAIFKIGRRTYIRTVDAQAWLDGYVRTPDRVSGLVASVMF
jgi:hypothetical protein